MSSSSRASHLALLGDQAQIPSAAYVLIAMAVVLTKWDRSKRTRKALKGLEPHLLVDVGLTKGAARDEAAKPFWQD